jgi:hypothetical protein
MRSTISTYLGWRDDMVAVGANGGQSASACSGSSLVNPEVASLGGPALGPHS